MKSLIFIFIGLLSLPSIFAQDSNKDLTNYEEEEERQSIYNYYFQNPLNINTVTEAEWNSLSILTKSQIDDFMQHRDRIKEFLSIYELQVIPQFDLITLRKLSPFIQCNSLQSKLFEANQANHQILLKTDFTLEEKKGFSPPDSRSKVRYLGNPFNQTIRYRAKINPNLRWGILSQKDAGETSWTDFTSAFVEIKFNHFVEKIILGDFLNQWGQGLMQSGGFSLGKSYESIKATQRFHIGGLAYSSVGENGFYRGIHATFRISKSLQFQAFYSIRKLDATLGKDSSSKSFIKSWDIDGFHRTESELSKKENVDEFSSGGSWQYMAKWPLMMQFNIVATTYSLPKIASNLAYKQSEWSGQQLYNSSFSFQFPWNNIQLMGELAMTWPKSLAILQGGAFSLSKKVDFSYSARMYSPSYFSPKSQGFGEASSTSNEYGLFVGNQIQLNRRSKISSYFDFFLFPNLKYQVSKKQSSGWELLSRYQWEKRNKKKFFVQLKWTSKEGDGPAPLYPITRTHQFQGSWDLIHYFQKNFSLHTRVMLHYIYSNIQSELGILLLEDVKYQIKKWEFSTRLAYYHTPSYDTRLYAYEMSVPYAFSLPAYNGIGFRNVLVIENKINQHINIAIKLGRSQYLDREEIGSGYDLINANHKTDVIGQLVFKL
ncbi:MAG: ComEA family DNA-binding protein [Aquirufa sp.]